MEFIENLFNNAIFRYCLIFTGYFVCVLIVALLLLGRKKKNYNKVKNDSIPKNLESVDLEAVLGEMQENVGKQKDEIMTFEEEQEEKAIISYQELLNAVKKNVKEVTTVQETTSSLEETAEVPLEPIVLQNDDDIKAVDEEEPELKVKQTKFQNSEFISPIYGRLNNDIEYPKIPAFEDQDDKEDELEKTIVLPELSSSIDDNDKFLETLKEFRNNLE